MDSAVKATPAEQYEEKASRTNGTAWEVLGDFTTTTRVLPISALAIFRERTIKLKFLPPGGMAAREEDSVRVG